MANRATHSEKPRENIRPEDCFWYHTMDLPGIGEVQGEWDLRGNFEPYIGHVDLRERSVLDIGTASGFLSFSAEAAGAASVVSFDIDIAERQHLLPFKDSLYYRDHAAWAKERTADFERWKNGYWLAHQALGSQARAVYGDVYNLPTELGEFDVVIFCAVLEHLADPIRAM
jgi:2-polyprenyl-3-methyl-5-hydroxy-6-metoxy-1,4-benzoquinol methylase